MYLVISALVIFVGYVCTNLSVDISTVRYLTFTILSIYFIIALSYQKSNKIYAILILILLSSSAIANYTLINKYDYQVNKGELDLIGYLTENNLKYGYADYWDSNIITYLSKEKIVVSPVTIRSYKFLEPFRWLSCEKWFTRRIENNSTQGYFILVSPNRPFLKDADINEYIKYNSLTDNLRFRDYKIYVFDGRAPLI